MYSARQFDNGGRGGRVGRARGGDRFEPYGDGGRSDGRPRRGRGGAGGSARGRDERGGRARKEEPKTAEELDDDMDSYWGKTAPPKDEATAGADKAQGAEPKGRGKKGRGKEEPPAKEDLDDALDSYFKGGEGDKAAAAPAPEEPTE